jgi:hypothetical protein
MKGEIMTGIENVLKTIKDLEAVAVDGIALAKAATRGPLGIGGVFAGVVKVAGDVKDLVADAPKSLPELKDLDGAEVGQIGASAYGCVKAVLVALAA